jgi:hypothetical protein
MVSQFNEDGNVPTSWPEKFVQGVDNDYATWDVTPDDSHVVALEKRPSPQLKLILNWFEELKRLVPTESD